MDRLTTFWRRRVDTRKLLDSYQFGVATSVTTSQRCGMKDLIDFIIENEVKAIFIETSISDKNLRAVLEGAKARGYEVKIGGTLFSDALGKEGTSEGTYKGMLESNVNTIINGLR